MGLTPPCSTIKFNPVAAISCVLIPPMHALTIAASVSRELVQFGSTLALGARSYRFKSYILDHMRMITQAVEGNGLENRQQVNSLAKVRILHHPPLFLFI